MFGLVTLVNMPPTDNPLVEPGRFRSNHEMLLKVSNESAYAAYGVVAVFSTTMSRFHPMAEMGSNCAPACADNRQVPTRSTAARRTDGGRSMIHSLQRGKGPNAARVYR